MENKIEKEFRKLIDNKEWFFNSLENKSIDLWNLSPSYIVIRHCDFRFYKNLGYKIIDIYKDIALLNK